MNTLHLIQGPDAVPTQEAARLAAHKFNGGAGQLQRITDPQGHTCLYVGIGTQGDIDFWLGAQACAKAKGLSGLTVQNPEALPPEMQAHFALSWLLESYRYGAFQETEAAPVLDGLGMSPRVLALAAGLGLTRDLINTPANYMRPGDLAREARDLADIHGAEVEVISGEALAVGFPLIHAVGAAAGEGAMAPRLIDMRWGDVGPTLTLVGKGITFDTGGLDLKPANAMRLMKKDMGGAAHVLGLAHMIMGQGLRLRLRVLIPAAENAVGQGAFRPGDVITSRAGLNVEIDNTDAEGRLVLADALTYAGEGQKSDLTITMATLTGAARVAVGPKIAPYLTNDPQLTWQLLAASDQNIDPLWPLPLFSAYDSYLKSDVADMVNSGGGGFAGTITAALFLKKFVGDATWAHFDVYGWNPEAAPGRPKGGGAQGLISLLTYLEEWTPSHG